MSFRVLFEPEPEPVRDPSAVPLDQLKALAERKWLDAVKAKQERLRLARSH